MATLGTAPVSQVTEAKMPEWFARQRAARNHPPISPPSPASSTSGPSDRHTWHYRLWHSFVGAILAGYGLSALLHLIALLVFSLIMWTSSVGGNSISTVLGIDTGETEELLDPQSFEISAGSEGLEEVQPVVDTIPLDIPEPLPPVSDSAPLKLPGVAEGTGKDDKTETGSGTDTQFAMPRGASVVREGSFAAWTIPARPRVRQDYMIVVEVTLPEGTTEYFRDDLVGELSGTDGYRVMIPRGQQFNGFGWQPPSRAPRFHRSGNVARIVFFVLGSNEPLVRDTIKIQSRLLRETQRLEIVF